MSRAIGRSETKPDVFHNAVRTNHFAWHRLPSLVYDESRMRRALSSLLILLFWLGPLSVVLPASAESRLPACCRRHGAHHCAMAEMASQPNSRPAFAAPGHCPHYPDALAASVTVADALTPPPAALLSLRSQNHARIASTVRVSSASLRSRSSRAPPDYIFS